MQLETIPNQPVIDTERLILRPLRKSDSGPLEMFCADERVARMTRDIPHPLPPGAIEGFVARATAEERDEDVWVMDGSQSGQGTMLGLISLERMDRAQSEIAYWVVPAFWNTGLASEAVRALVAANPRGDKTMFASVFQDNPASARVLTNTGFEYLGDAEAYSVARAHIVPTWTYLKRLE
ncbi:GNAT family N-acetyltransferase [Alphaproteobacteria bacterium GH1-50]|uniref:GNAT family N-acetyltransferase n=1 Tax=Kangsaoukella pontilimi TaxID=2691042 RepID=A0A7C9J2V2_9RHOB|nr:GNAT family N-acetyltransferase [Kangsaoukella pontilimi]MXQ07821.1 GNAT family N-acetyltransferase [Kangsaoukella pontilimi]